VNDDRQLSLLQWSADFGGAEVLSMELAAAMRRSGVDAEVLFVLGDGPMADRLRTAGVPYRVLGFKRGRDVVAKPRKFARETAAGARDGALLPECGFIGAALRAGGFGAPIVAVEHGALFNPRSSPVTRIAHGLARRFAAWADDVEVAVSDYTLERMREGPHARSVRRIHNAVDCSFFAPDGAARASGGVLAVGFAGRLIPGKGADHLIRAVARSRDRVQVWLYIAGDGPERERLASLARELGIADRVEFLGVLGDVRELWRQCDVAAFPSDQFIDSFGIAALEAMACGKPVVATRNGGVPEVVLDQVSGIIVTPGDVERLADALIAYGEDADMRARHGKGARARALAEFDIERCAAEYLALFSSLAGRRPRLAPSGYIRHVGAVRGGQGVGR
jgi:glycosyltransferase involved in cell wall biosynthesis